MRPCADGSPIIFEETGSLATGRVYHAQTLLPNGKVLVTGGFNDIDVFASAELYDPATETWMATGSLNVPRFRHTATLLPDGRVLVAGGLDLSGAIGSAELYDPATETWTETGSLNVARGTHTATLLQNGMVLVAAGGTSYGGGYIASAELYDPATGTWTETGSLAAARLHHRATLLPDGTVLVAGGRRSSVVAASTDLSVAARQPRTHRSGLRQPGVLSCILACLRSPPSRQRGARHRNCDTHSNCDTYANCDTNSHSDTWTDHAQRRGAQGGRNKYGASHLERSDLGQHRRVSRSGCDRDSTQHGQ